MEPIALDELKNEKCARISAQDLIQVCDLGTNGSKHTSGRGQKAIVIDIRSPEEYPF